MYFVHGIGFYLLYCLNRISGPPIPEHGPSAPLRRLDNRFNMTRRLSGHFSIFGLIFFVLKSLLGIVRQWSREKFAILTLKPRSHVRIVNISNLGY